MYFTFHNRRYNSSTSHNPHNLRLSPVSRGTLSKCGCSLGCLPRICCSNKLTIFKPWYHQVYNRVCEELISMSLLRSGLLKFAHTCLHPVDRRLFSACHMRMRRNNGPQHSQKTDAARKRSKMVTLVAKIRAFSLIRFIQSLPMLLSGG